MNLQNVTAQTIKDAEKWVKDNFINADGVVEYLKMFIANNLAQPMTGNLILYGPGGYGKTEMASGFLRIATGHDPFIVNMNSGTTVQEIFGGYDIAAFGNGDGIQYNFDYSFMAHPWCVFEEAFDVRPRVLSSTKYPISNLKFALAGVEQRDIHTKGIIIVTNKDTSEFMAADDTAAFLERFPFRYRVSWDELTAGQRVNSSMYVIKKFDPKNMLTSNQQQKIANYATNTKMSPRMIGRAVQTLTSMASMLDNNAKTVSNDVFAMVGRNLGFLDAEDIKEVKKDEEKALMEQTKSKFELYFKQLSDNLSKFDMLGKAELQDFRYLIHLAESIMAADKLVTAIDDSVPAIRTNVAYGEYSVELAGWINTQLAEYAEKLDNLRRQSWSGMLDAVLYLEKFMQKHGFDPDKTRIDMDALFEEYKRTSNNHAKA